MSDILAFLNARWNEIEARAWAIHDVGKCDALLYEEDMADAAASAPDCDCGHPARVLADLAGKRQIIAEVTRIFGINLDVDCGQTAVLKALALPFADHPNYDEAWRP